MESDYDDFKSDTISPLDRCSCIMNDSDHHPAPFCNSPMRLRWPITSTAARVQENVKLPFPLHLWVYVRKKVKLQQVIALSLVILSRAKNKEIVLQRENVCKHDEPSLQPQRASIRNAYKLLSNVPTRVCLQRFSMVVNNASPRISKMTIN